MDDFEEIEGAADPASPNSSTRPRNDTERNTNEVASMPTGTLCALALAVLDVSVAADTDKIIKAARDKLTALEAQHPLTFYPLVSSSYPLREKNVFYEPVLAPRRRVWGGVWGPT